MALGFPPAIRVANRASTRPIIHSPAPTPPARRPTMWHPIAPGFRPAPPPPPSRFNPFAFDRLRAEAAARAATNAQLIAQQAAMQAMQAQQQSMLPTQQVQTSPAAPAADLTPAQDNTAAADAASADSSHPHNKHMLLFAGIAVAAGVGGYMLIKKHKKG